MRDYSHATNIYKNKCFMYVRKINPHIPAWRVLEYLNTLVKSGHLTMAFKHAV